MAFILQANASAGDAYVEKDLGSDQPDVWVTFRLFFSNATAAQWIATNSGYLLALLADPINLDDVVYVTGGEWQTAFTSVGGGAPVGNAWTTVEMHHENGVASELYLNGTLVCSAGDDLSQDTRIARFGFEFGPADPTSVVRIGDVKIGTSRGASDLFADDFSSGDLSAWDTEVGDVAVIDQPEGVSFAPDFDALDPDPIWVRLDDPDGYDVAQSWSIHRGRSGEMDKTGTGIATVTFKDTTGLLDPTNTSGPFYGFLDPMKQFAIALQHPITGEWFPLFRGFLSSQDHDMDMWSDVRGIDTVTWEAADAFDLFGAILLTPGVHGDPTSLADFGDVYYNGTPGIPTQPDVFVHVDDHIVKLLDDAGWPGTGAFDTLRDIFSGNVSVQGKTYSRDQLLSALFDAADAEFPGVANVYMSKTGVVTFRGRFARFFPTNPGYGITTWEAGGMPEALADNTVAPIAGLQFRRSKEDIINSVLAMPQGADDSDIAGLITEDGTSISTFGYRSETFTDLLTSAGHTDATPTTAAEETKKFAEYYVGNYKDPKTRVSVITFRPRAPEDPTAQALWDLVCGVEIGDRVHLQTTHVGGGGFDEMFYVEGIRYEARGARPEYHDITCELEVSPSSFFDYNPFGTVDGTA